jgi:hypothetical protein
MRAFAPQTYCAPYTQFLYLECHEELFVAKPMRRFKSVNIHAYESADEVAEKETPIPEPTPDIELEDRYVYESTDEAAEEEAPFEKPTPDIELVEVPMNEPAHEFAAEEAPIAEPTDKVATEETDIPISKDLPVTEESRKEPCTGSGSILQQPREW